MAIRDTRACLAGLADPPPQARVFLICDRHHRDDPGSLSVFFLNLLHLAPGRALFVPPNEPHAYLTGDIVECMAASDNVVRAGLTRRRVDRDVLLSLLSYRSWIPAVLAGTADGAGVLRYAVPADEFELEFRTVAGPAEVLSESGISLLLVLDGGVRLATAGWSTVATRGTALVWPAAVPSLRVEAVTTPARWVRAFPARRHRWV
jgi:mannose-6-phosphate isomerase